MSPTDRSEPAKWVERLLRPDWSVISRAQQRLREIGESAVPAMVAALTDSRFHVKHEGGHSVQPTPLAAVLDVLQEYAPIEAIAPLNRLLDHDSEYVRKEVALALGWFGRSEAVPALRKALRDPDHYVRSYAVMGIGRGCEKSHCPEAFRRELFDDVAAKLDDVGIDGEAEDAMIPLLQLDRDRAVSILLDARYFHAGYREIWNIFRAFAHFSLPLPGDRLAALLPGLQERRTEIPYCWAYTCCLSALAPAGQPHAFEWLRAAIETGFQIESFASEGRPEEDASSYETAIGALARLDDERVEPFLHQLAADPRPEASTPARQVLEARSGEAPGSLSPAELALRYLQGEGIKAGITLHEEKRIDESAWGGDEAVIFWFSDSGGEPHYVIVGLLTNNYPQWGLNPDEIYELHLGLSDDPGPCTPEERIQYAERLTQLLAQHGLTHDAVEVIEIWKAPSPRRRRKKVLAALVRAGDRLQLLVGRTGRMICAEGTWRGEPIPSFVHLRRYLGRRIWEGLMPRQPTQSLHQARTCSSFCS